MSNILILLSFIMMGVPPAMLRYNKYQQMKEVEESFPDFIRDITEGLRGGMTLSLAIKYASNNNYGALNSHIKTLVAQITWGIPFDNALHNFVKSIDDPTITRAISTVIEAHRSGGNIAEALDAVGKSTVEIEKLRRERTSRISSQMMTGYVIFFIFVVIMIGMREFLLPALTWGSATSPGAEEMMAASNANVNVEAYGRMFSHLAIIQGIFSGLAIGKLAEGNLSAGVKHAALMSLMGYITLMLAHTLLGGASVVSSVGV
ncbi:MAG: type II secretion system F family protein [Nanoarchaeota archaeon]|nr:type II secretion system F family protein [Nanoarchaeota archaeon]MBU4451611.1 type II secretion system F family protein [Nanoarchaeota archaeon]MCG2723133.1 type II secretion system F family protein [archaeon]